MSMGPSNTIMFNEYETTHIACMHA